MDLNYGRKLIMQVNLYAVQYEIRWRLVYTTIEKRNIIGSTSCAINKYTNANV